MEIIRNFAKVLAQVFYRLPNNISSIMQVEVKITRTEIPSPFRLSTTAPCSTRNRAVSTFSTVYRGVSPSLSVMLTSPPWGIYFVNKCSTDRFKTNLVKSGILGLQVGHMKPRHALNKVRLFQIKSTECRRRYAHGCVCVCIWHIRRYC